MPNKGVTSTTAETTTAEAEVLYESRVPFYGTIIIAAAGCFLLVCCCFWMCLRLCQKKPKQAKGLLKTKGASPSVLRESIQPDLEGGDEIDGMPKIVGKLHFTVEHTRSTCSLTVNVIEAHELAAMDLGGSSDPYIKVRLLPNKKPIFTTKIVKESLNPLFNETFTFEVLPEQLQMRTLQFQIFDYDLLSANDRIGSVTVPLSELDLSKLVDEWRDLVKAGEDTCDVADIPGDICVSLRYVAAASLLTVVVIEAKNVPMNDDGNDTDSFVKLTLYIGGKRVKRKRTTVRKSSSNPYFNEPFTFELAYQHAATARLDIALCAPHFIKAKRIGFIEVGLEVPSIPQSVHWKDMLANQRHSIARWHRLQTPDED